MLGGLVTITAFNTKTGKLANKIPDVRGLVIDNVLKQKLEKLRKKYSP